MSEFIYTPRAGSRVFAARLSHGRLMIVTWWNGSHHVLGSGTSVVFDAASRAWRAAARRVLATAAPPFDLLAWDVQGEIHLRMAGNPRAQASLLAVLRETSLRTGGPTADLTGQLVVSPEWKPVWSYIQPARLLAEPSVDPELAGQLPAEEPVVTLEADPKREGQARWCVTWSGDAAVAGGLGAPVVNGQPYTADADGAAKPWGQRQCDVTVPLRYGQAVTS